MSTLEEIEKAVDALPAEQQQALLRRLSGNLEESRPRNGMLLPPPKVPIEEIERLEALIEAEFSHIPPHGC
jgi:hypothetical protein